MNRDPQRLTWQRSARCVDPTGNCVEIALDGEWVYLRDSKDATGAVLVFDRTAWAGFIAGAAAGEFDGNR